MLRKTFALITLTLGLIALPRVVRAAPQTDPNTGSISGCVTDNSGAPLPRDSVTVGRDGRRLKVVTADASGCYAFTDLPRGSYFVFVTLTGFASATRDEILVEPGQPQVVFVQLRVLAICECVDVPGMDTLAGLWESADAVVRVRITGHAAREPETRHTAAVLQAWKGSATFPIADSLTFATSGQGEVEPYAVGQEFVLFLKWAPSEGAFTRLGNGVVFAFAVEDGRVRNAGFGSPVVPNARWAAGYLGAPVDSLANDLNALADSSK